MGVWPGPHGFSGILQGDFGWSFEFNKPVSEVVGSAMWMTILVNLVAVLFVYIVALPLGVLAAALRSAELHHAMMTGSVFRL